MTRAYSIDLRERVVARVMAGDRVQAVSERFGVSVASVVAAAPPDRQRRAGPHGFPARQDPERRSSRGFTLRGLVAELATERGVTVDYRTVWNFVHDEGLSFKKSVLPSEQDRADVARRRARWKARQRSIDPRRLVFIDETWAKTNMAPLRDGPREADVSRPAFRTLIGKR